jgi:hypothetical protein
MTTIEINGKVLRLQFGMHVAEFMGDLFAENIGSVEKTAILINLAHENYLKVDRKAERLMDEGEIYAAIEEATISANAELVNASAAVWSAFTQSPLVKSLLATVEKSEPVDDKKKQVGRKLKSSPSE